MMKNNHTSYWYIMWIISDIINISFSLYLKGNVTYKCTTNVHTLQTRTTMSKSLDVLMCLYIKWNLFRSTVVITVLHIANDLHG